jgi:hypothetical protein
MDPARTAAFGATLATLHAELDWDLLGALYCHEGGEHFFPPEQREAILDAGLHFASDLGELLGPGRSIYVGAALAELAPLLFEHLVLAREVVLKTLPGREADELDRALALAEARVGERLPRFDRAPLGPAPAGSVDHVWCVSVLTDPDAFPTLHDALYERRHTPLAVGGGDRKRERARAEGLCGQLVAALRPGRALVTTSDEERPLFERALAAAGRVLEVPQKARLSGIVGDAVRHCRVHAARAGGN